MQVELTQEVVRELLDYDPATGVLTWRRRDKKWFVDGVRNPCAIWNARYAGKPAGSIVVSDGYARMYLRIFNRRYAVHRVIFLWMVGRWPDPEIDHDNRDGVDNRWCNLIESTHLNNTHNMSLSKANTTGRVGVYIHSNGKFRSTIMADGRRIHLGYFDLFDDACSAREVAERIYGFHENHGGCV